MTFSQFLTIIRVRIWIFLATLFVTIGTAVALSVLLPERYKATTTVVVDFKGADPVMGMMLPVQMMPGYLATQVDIVGSHRVAVEVVRRLRVAESPAARKDWLEETEGRGTIEDYYADLLLKKLEVEPGRDSSVIAISFSGSSPEFAAAIANAFAEAYQKTNLELKVQPARQTAAWFDERLQKLRKNLEEAQARLSQYQRDKGFTAQDERLDLESGRLNELSAQYTATQAQAADAQSKLRQLNEYMQRGASIEALPDVLANPLIQNLKVQLTQTEARLQQASSQFGRNHPEVKRLEADIDGQKAKLKIEIASAASAIKNVANIALRREADLSAQVAAQKNRLLKSNFGRDEYMVLMKEVENAQRAYDAASQRFQQTSLESQVSQTNVSVLTPAVPPVEASFPIIPLNVALAVVLGSMLGIGLCLLAEMLDRRIRSTMDLEDAVAAPILGVVMKDSTIRKRSRGGFKFGRKSTQTAAVSIQKPLLKKAG